MSAELIKQVSEKLAAMIPFNKEGDRSEDFETWMLLHTCKEEILRLTTELKESQALGLRFAQDRETNDLLIENLKEQIKELKIRRFSFGDWQ